ncbi:hypothetical protein L596_018805 [Steinernema carpocapsae]|uniref:Uncharacterized protein n=1 Tax=Steinernema carpocapsae TaxID=34508 RepID=A0A4V6A251_STECR|nr:hypothetical protein L596_018805 [Steinernema carpocapsae]
MFRFPSLTNSHFATKSTLRPELPVLRKDQSSGKEEEEIEKRVVNIAKNVENLLNFVQWILSFGCSTHPCLKYCKALTSKPMWLKDILSENENTGVNQEHMVVH